MVYLVTGGLGFVGSNLIHALIDQAIPVISVDNRYIGDPFNIPTGIINYMTDVSTTTYLNVMTMKEMNIEGIFHLAALSSSSMLVDNPKRGIEVNVIGFLNTLELARKWNTPVVYASTSSLYHSQHLGGSTEKDPVVPRTAYESSLQYREVLARQYYERYGVRSIGLRFFSLYGPRELHKGRYANVITQMLFSASNKTVFEIYGNGLQRRDFVHVWDAVDALIKSMKYLKKKHDCAIFNVCTGRSVSFREVTFMISQFYRPPLKTKLVRLPVHGYIQNTHGNPKCAEEFLGFKSQIRLEEGIIMQIGYIDSLKDALETPKWMEKL